MIIYNRDWLRNRKIQDQVSLAFELGEINAEELRNVKEKYPVGFYTPNIFIRIGIFLLTLVILSFSISLLSLFLYGLHVIESPYYLLFLGLSCYAALEFMVRKKHHYQSGADDALMWVSAGLLLSAYIYLMDELFLNTKSPHQELFLYGFSFLLACYFLFRFADPLMTALALPALGGVVFYGWFDFGLYALQTLPFIMMTLFGGVYYLATRLEHGKIYLFYNNCIVVARLVGLLLFYVSGNYFIVREMGAQMSNSSLQEGHHLPFGWFFWLWTLVIPLAYIGSGLQKKDLILLRSGLLLVAAAAFTLKHYYYLMPTELLLVIAGVLLTGIAWSTSRYLRTPKHGFTAKAEEGNVLDSIQVESLIVGETFSGTQAGAGRFRMGGGDFGGGGASGNF